MSSFGNMRPLILPFLMVKLISARRLGNLMTWTLGLAMAFRNWAMFTWSRPRACSQHQQGSFFREFDRPTYDVALFSAGNVADDAQILTQLL